MLICSLKQIKYICACSEREVEIERNVKYMYKFIYNFHFIIIRCKDDYLLSPNVSTKAVSTPVQAPRPMINAGFPDGPPRVAPATNPLTSTFDQCLYPLKCSRVQVSPLNVPRNIPNEKEDLAMDPSLLVNESPTIFLFDTMYFFLVFEFTVVDEEDADDVEDEDIPPATSLDDAIGGGNAALML